MAFPPAAAARTCSASSATDAGAITGTGPKPSIRQQRSSIPSVYEKSKGFFSGGRRPGFWGEDALGDGRGEKKSSAPVKTSEVFEISEAFGPPGKVTPPKGFRAFASARGIWPLPPPA